MNATLMQVKGFESALQAPMIPLEDIRVGAPVCVLLGKKVLLDSGLFDFEAFGIGRMRVMAEPPCQWGEEPSA